MATAGCSSSSVIQYTQFYKKLEDFYLQKPLRKPYSKQKIDDVIEKILAAKQKL